MIGCILEEVDVEVIAMDNFYQSVDSWGFLFSVGLKIVFLHILLWKVENRFGMFRAMDKYCLLHLVVGDGQSLSTLGSSSILGKKRRQKIDEKNVKRAVRRMRWICQPKKSGAIWSGSERSRDKWCYIYGALIGIHTLCKELMSLKYSRNLLTVFYVVLGTQISRN